MQGDDKNLPLTHNGDCGAVSIDQNGIPVSVHITLLVLPPRGRFEKALEDAFGFVQQRPYFLKQREFTSFSVPLSNIIRAHQNYFETSVAPMAVAPRSSPQSPVTRQSAAFLKDPEFNKKRVVRHERADISYGPCRLDFKRRPSRWF